MGDRRVGRLRVGRRLGPGTASPQAFLAMMWVRTTAANTVNTAAMIIPMYWLIGFERTFEAFVKTLISCVLLSHSWLWICLTFYTLFSPALGVLVPTVLQGCLSLTYLFIHPDRTPAWLRYHVQALGLRRLPFRRRRLPSNRRRLPSNRRRLPSNRRRLPSNRRRLPSNRRQLPFRRRRLPFRRRRLPSDRRRLPFRRRRLPSNRRRLPSNRRR